MLSAMTPTPNLVSVLAGWDKWCRKKDLNSRPSTYKDATLPLCYSGSPNLQSIYTKNKHFAIDFSEKM